MKYFAHINSGNVVINVYTVNDADAPTEEAGVAFLRKTVKINNGTQLKECHKGAAGSWHPSTGKYPSNGYVYDESKGGFIPAQPFSSWTWDSTNKGWKPPVDAPQPPVWAGDDPTSDETTAIKKSYTWDEDAYQADTNDPKTAGWVEHIES